MGLLPQSAQHNEIERWGTGPFCVEDGPRMRAIIRRTAKPESRGARSLLPPIFSTVPYPTQTANFR
jgi:hypothetical protein